MQLHYNDECVEQKRWSNVDGIGHFGWNGEVGKAATIEFAEAHKAATCNV